MAQELLKSFEELDRIEGQYLSQIFADDEEIENIQALAVKEALRCLRIAKPKKNLKHL